MAKLGRLLAALFLAAGLFAAVPALAQNAGQNAPCPLVTRAKVVADTTYLLSANDRCQWIVFTSSGVITVQLPAPGQIFGPDWAAKMLVTNGGALSFVNLADQTGVQHLVNLGASLTLASGSGAELRVLQDFNWWIAIQGGSSIGTVTSVGMTVPAEFSVGGSPVLNTGVLAISKLTQIANTVWAGPTSGGPAQPGFRAIVAADLPALACGVLSDFGTACRANTGSSGHTLGFLDVSNLFSAGQAVTPVTVTKSVSTFTPDFATSNIFRLTLDAVGMTLANPSNMVAGKCGVVELVQDGTGNRTITTWGSFWKFPGGTKPTLSTVGGSVDSVSYCSTTSTFIEASSLGNFQ